MRTICVTILAAAVSVAAVCSVFAAGAMFYVVVEELIPETAKGEHTNVSTVCFAVGFVLMMALDVLFEV